MSRTVTGRKTLLKEWFRHGGAQEWPCRACPQDPVQSHTAASVTSMVPGQRRGRRTGKAHRGDAVEGCYK